MKSASGHFTLDLGYRLVASLLCVRYPTPMGLDVSMPILLVGSVRSREVRTIGVCTDTVSSLLARRGQQHRRKFLCGVVGLADVHEQSRCDIAWPQLFRRVLPPVHHFVSPTHRRTSLRRVTTPYMTRPGADPARVSHRRIVVRSLQNIRPLQSPGERQRIGHRGMLATRCIRPYTRRTRQAGSIEPHSAGLASSQVIGRPLLHHTDCTLTGITGLASILALSVL